MACMSGQNKGRGRKEAENGSKSWKITMKSMKQRKAAV